MDEKIGVKPKSRLVKSEGKPQDTEATKPVGDLSFEQAMAELEQVVAALESNDAPLADSLAAYQRGAALMRHAQEILSHVEAEIEVVEAGQTLTLSRAELIAQTKD